MATDELRIAASFAKHVPDLSGLALSRLKPPEPDILAEQGELRVGIELTEIPADQGARRAESEQDGMIARAEALYKAEGPPNVCVTVYWHDHFSPTKRDRSSLTHELAQIVRANLPALGGETSLGVGFGAVIPFRHRAFERIDIHREIEFDEGLWYSPRSWWGSVAGPELIQAHIDRKKSKPALYRQKYSGRWLVLIHHGHQPSSGYDLPEDIKDLEYQSAFDRVFLFSLGQQVIELRTKGCPP